MAVYPLTIESLHRLESLLNFSEAQEMFTGSPPINTRVGGSGVGSVPPNNPNGNAPNQSAVVQVSHAPPGSPRPFPPAVGPGPMVDNPTGHPQTPGPLAQAAAATLPLVRPSDGTYGRGPVLGQLSNDVLGHINGFLEGDIVNQRAFLIATNPYNATRPGALTSIGVTEHEKRDAILANDPEARARNLIVDGLDWVPDDQLGPHVASIYNQLRLLETWPSLQQQVVSHLETAFDRLFAPSLDGMSDAQVRTYTSNLFGQLSRLAAWPSLQQRVVSRLETAYDRLFAPGLNGMPDAQLRTYMSNLIHQLPRLAALPTLHQRVVSRLENAFDRFFDQIPNHGLGIAISDLPVVSGWPSLEQRVVSHLETAFAQIPNEDLHSALSSLFTKWPDWAFAAPDTRNRFMNIIRAGCEKSRALGQANGFIEDLERNFPV